MLRRHTRRRAIGPAEHDGAGHLTAGHVVGLGRRVDDVVNRLHGEVEGHELDNRVQAAPGRAHRDAGKADLGDRGVDHPLGPEFVQQTLGNLVGALVFAHLFAHQEHIRIGAHFLGHRLAQGLAHGHGLHRRAGRPIGAGLRHHCNRCRRNRLHGGSRRSGFSPTLRSHRGRGGRGILALFHQHHDRRVHLHIRGARGDQNAAHHALIDRLELHRRLVGLDLGQNLARLHLVAFLHQPFGQRAFFHRGRQRGHQYFGCHDLSPPQA